MAEQTGDGTGEQVLNPAAGARQFRASDWCGARGRGFASRAPGLRRGSARGHNGPLPGAG